MGLVTDTVARSYLVKGVEKGEKFVVENSTLLILGAIGAIFLYNGFSAKLKAEIIDVAEANNIPVDIFQRVVAREKNLTSDLLNDTAQELAGLYTKYKNWNTALIAFYWGVENVTWAIAGKKDQWLTVVPERFKSTASWMLYGG